MAAYLPQQKILFIHIPKTGGTSVRDWLLKNVLFSTNVKPKHGRIDIFKNFDYHMYFTVVRNPYARLLSWYVYHDDVLGRSLGSITPEGFRSWLVSAEKEPNLKDCIWWSQKSYIDSSNHVILKTENLEKDFEVMQQLLNNHSPLSVVNQSSVSVNYRDFYDDVSKKIVKDLYGEDLDYFDYTF